MNKYLKQKKQKMKKRHKSIWKNREHPRGMLGKKASEETKRKMSESHKGKTPWNKGLKLGRNKKHSEIMKRLFDSGKLTPWNKGLPKEKQPCYGKYLPISEETKRKMSKIRKHGIKEGRIKNTWEGKRLSKEHRKNISKNHRRYQTKETIEKIKNNVRINKDFGMRGKKQTREAIKKIREARAKQILPKKDTTIEVKIQNFLKQLNIEFFTHQYMKEIEHGYQCDILIPIQNGINKKTIIECFGNYWHKFPMGREIDIQRCSELREKGWRVLTFWESEIKPMQLNNLQEKLIC